MDTSYNERNRAQTERLKALDRLSDEQLSRPVGEHWTVAIALAHIAHVDERVLAVLELSLRYGIPRHWWTMDEALAVNDARLPLWRALPPREALRRAILAAEALDRVIRDLPPDVVEAVAAERPRSLDRSLHRVEHLDEVDQALGPSGVDGMAQQERWQLADAAAENYERYRVPAMFGPLADELVASAGLRPGDRVLDIACGTGIVARRAARQLDGQGRVVGLDINPGMLAVARSVAAAEGLVIEWREVSAMALPFAEGSFDAVFCQQALQFFPDRAAALREMRRVLRWGGRLAVSVFRSLEHRPDLAAVAATLERHLGPQAGAPRLAVVSLGDADELQRLIAGAGFGEVQIRPVVTTQRFASVEAYLHDMEVTAPSTDPVGRLDEATRRAVLADLSAALRPYLTEEALVFPAGSHLATARK